MTGFLRPDLRRLLWRWREVLAGLAVVLAGWWLARLGGPFWLGVGVVVALAGAAVALGGWMRARFANGAAGAGVVQVVEGQIAYFGPQAGGFVALGDVTSLAIAPDGAGGFVWIVASPDTRLEIPAGATGAEALFDAFASLPGVDMSRIASAAAAMPAPPSGARAPLPVDLSGPGTAPAASHSPARVLWRRPGAPRLT